MTEKSHLFVFGPGYSAQPFMAKAKSDGWQVSATFRKPEDGERLTQQGYAAVPFSAFQKGDTVSLGLDTPVSHVLTSVAPSRDTGKDPVLDVAHAWLCAQTTVRWIGYLSSTNVYGDHNGAWVDEETQPKPSLERGKRRLLAEENWLSLGESIGASTHVFRLAGIYGPGKNALMSVQSGKAKRIFKEGQVFGRIHRDDIAQALWLAATSSVTSSVFNLSDDLPSPPQDVIEEAARLLGAPLPELVAFEDAEMSPMGRSFYAENKRVKNDRAKNLLGWTLKYPDYKTALAKMLETETW